MSATLVKIITLRCRATTNLKKDDGLGDGIPLNWPCFLFVFPLFSTKKKKKKPKLGKKGGKKSHYDMSIHYNNEDRNFMPRWTTILSFGEQKMNLKFFTIKKYININIKLN